MENLKVRSRHHHTAGNRDRRDDYSPYWLSPVPSLTLSSNDVHVWLTKLDLSAVRVQQLAQCLVEEELRRAEGFYFKRDKKRFIVGRGVLRVILGRYLNIEPNCVRFSHDLYQKPCLAERLGDGTLRFNLAHSNELALYAFTREREIGVDVEYIRNLPDAGQMANRFFSFRENAILQALPESQRQIAFFNCWTRKEAYLKALGVGLYQDLDQFDVSLIPVEPARLIDVEIIGDDASRWTLKALTPTAGYVAALAVEGHNWRPTFWRFPESTSKVCQPSQTPWAQ
jgi:4'-phosphopantetheinyl transferase